MHDDLDSVDSPNSDPSAFAALDGRDGSGAEDSDDARDGRDGLPADDVVIDAVDSARRMDEAKDEHLDNAIVALPIGSDPELEELVHEYYRHVSPDDIIERNPRDLIGAVTSHRETARIRREGTSVVRAYTPTRERDGWTSDHSVIEIVTDDMPFLVDSVSGALAMMDRPIHLIVHPQIPVVRDFSGNLQRTLDVDMGPLPDDAIIESWMHVEVERETSPSDLTQIELQIQTVLRSVREAVEDWPKLSAAAQSAADDIDTNRPSTVDPAEIEESIEFLWWLIRDNFTFLGYREYSLSESGEFLDAVPGTGLGIMRSDRPADRAHTPLTPDIARLAREPHILVLTKANTRSTVHRTSYLDYVGVKMFDDAGNVVGERRFLGLYTSSAYMQPIDSIPLLRSKVQRVLDGSELRFDSHSYKDLVQVLETYPRDELFEISDEELEATALGILHMQDRRQVRVFLRRDQYGRSVSCMVYLPRDRYTTAVRLEMMEILRREFQASSIDYTARVSESQLVRLHFVVRSARGQTLPIVDQNELEFAIAQTTRFWQDVFVDALNESCDEEEAGRLRRMYIGAFPEAYKEDFSADTGVADVLVLDDLEHDGALALNLYEPADAQQGERRFKIYRRGSEISLSTVLPVLQSLGVEVVDERPYDMSLDDGTSLWLYDFGIRILGGPSFDLPTLKSRFEDAFRAIWLAQAEVDNLNSLVVSAGLTWRQIVIIRAYTRYLRQAGTSFSQLYIEQTHISNVAIARSLVALFEARFDPARESDRAVVVEDIDGDIQAALDDVASLDQDRILRSFLSLISATLRTNFYQSGRDGQRHDYLSFKLDPAQIPDLPLPKPKFEIWVYSPKVEGVHLRFGSVARGGLRWSDRREDFRTEVLGLVKAQMVKNAVIIPVGAKGGFFVKRSPDPTVDRDAWLAEGIACYRVFISALLDITDNLVNGAVVPPVEVVRYDSDDPYLVVAADKGTATFSDIANDVAMSYGFWLGDAFASGGSAGYDHKAMGITARGAWESVKRHFRELGVDTQSEDFTVVGVGDMSGDVFGNGMLLSEHIRLVSAFDHRHIFIDPEPNAARSFAERQRLFDLPRSSWADYDASLISPGGGVFSRSAKAIALTPQIRKALDISEDVEHVTPQELMRAILCAPVDLLWNGGIGTYVKATSESQTDVGDKSNDAIRLNGSQLRARVVGEGGNLGFTQLGRIEAARAGVKLNTDAIDNSAGVDTSDHEVNIKILLDQVVRDGQLTTAERDTFLAGMTDEVAELVLYDNYAQNVTLGNDRALAVQMLSVQKRFIRSLEVSGQLERGLEFLPTDADIDIRMSTGHGLTSPELAVLLAYAKISLTTELTASSLADEPWFASVLREYFPAPIVERYGHILDAHPLRSEIITTEIANAMINDGGSTFVFRAVEETGAGAVEIARAYTVSREVFGLRDFWNKINELDSKIPTVAQAAMYLESRRLLDRATRWFIMARGGRVDVGGEIARIGDDLRRISSQVQDLLVGVEHDRLVRRTDELVALGAPDELALETASLLDAYGLLDVVEIARVTGADVLDVARLYFVLSERYEVDVMLSRITQLPRDDRWGSLARMALRSDLYGALSGLTRTVVEATPGMTDAVQRVESWESHQAEGLARARATLDEIAALETFDVATLSVALRTIRTLVR